MTAVPHAQVDAEWAVEKDCLRVLVVHNAYQHRGGEDSVVEAEIALLQAHGHAVETYFRSNDDVVALSSLALARHTLWSPRTTDDLGDLVARVRPDIIHAHNTFPLISPSLYWAAARCGVPIVQTLHNFRLMCLNALFLREGTVCEDCIGKVPWRGVTRGCYRESPVASAALAATITLHRAIGTWRNKVTRYIALTEFQRAKLIEGGLPSQRIVVKPNFVVAPPTDARPRDGFLFVGRFSLEKGLSVLVQALLELHDVKVRAAGEGPESKRLEAVPGVEILGTLPMSAVQAEMTGATALIMPSICYEGFPRTLVEAFAAGLPVIASRLGAMAALIEDGVTGLLFSPDDAADLANKMRWALAHPDDMARMGRAARACYEANYTPETNYRQLMAIYASALRDAGQEHRND